MAYWLFKEEPSTYNFTDLERDGQTTWDGVKNALALKHLRQVRRGDQVFFYQTGSDKAVVGVMEAVGDATDGPKGVAVRVKPVRRLPRPVTLAEIKTDPALAGWELTRLPRLSIIPVGGPEWRRVHERSRA
jgi:predicted RNA-binding protein with PUA-like domain